MKILTRKVLSYEEELVEYDNYEEYKLDLDKRRKEKWTREKKPCFYYDRMETVTKYRGDKIIQRYKRFGALNI